MDINLMGGVQRILGSFLLILFFLAPGLAFAATYYVDSSITDTNVGSATPDCTNYDPIAFTCSGGSASAYKTVADINAFSALAPGDSVLFRKGQIWREMLTVPSSGSAGNIITFGSYGSGAKPIITGSDLATGWSAYSTSGNYGDTNGSANGTEYTGNVYWHQITVGVTGTVSQIQLYVGASAPAGHYHVALYTDNSNQPGSLVANSTSIEKTTLTTNAWNTFTFASNPSVTAGTYWIATEGDHDFSRERPVAGSGGRESYQTIAYGAFPATATPASTFNYALDYSEYITVLASSTTVWQATDATQPLSVWFNGIHGTLVAGTSSIVSANQWYWASNVLYVYSTSNPGTAYTAPGIEVGARSMAIYLNWVNYITIDGLELRHSNGLYWGLLELNTATHNTIKNSTIHEGYYSDIHVSSTGSGSNNNVVTNNIISNSYLTSQLVIDTSGSNTVQQNTFSGDSGSVADFIFLTVANNNIVQNNTLSSPGANLFNGIYIKDGSSFNIVRYNNISGMPGPAVQIRGATASNHSNQVYDNVISGAGLAIQSDGDFGSGNDGTVIENNTIYASASNSNGIHLTHTNTNTVVKNNIVSVGAADAFNVAAASETGLVSNYNLFRNTSGNLIIWGTNNYTLAQFASYQSASSHDANSLTSDPLFTSTSDFHLLAGSPAINAGTNVSLTSDYAGTSVPQGPAPDIGAYEYIQNTAPTVSISLPSSSGNITVTATASATSPAAISSVQFYLDGSPLNSALAAAPYSTTLNTASLSNGTHTLYAVATDNYGNTATSQSASFNVNNGGGGGIVGSGP
ncbi:MAG TPA: choice-of-anchor Q domain-containing protein, partial [Candidatus Paceibacterota bacterium]|nr:choice-of-anchor Q domain-containing protein [Candidatus Paceibacterota bacterium]